MDPKLVESSETRGSETQSQRCLQPGPCPELTAGPQVDGRNGDRILGP